MTEQVYAARLRRPDAAHLGTHQLIWAIRSGHELPLPAVIELAAEHTTVYASLIWRCRTGEVGFAGLLKHLYQ